MKTTRWFDRTFDFTPTMEDFPHLLQRLQSSPIVLSEEVKFQPEIKLNYKPDGKWSVKEHIGHLWILEALWQKRFTEIKEQQPQMSPADLSNSATDKAYFNQYPLHGLLIDFKQRRNETLELLHSMRRSDFEYSLLHPRLKQPMRLPDLMYFVAEHDDHHLNAIKNLLL